MHGVGIGRLHRKPEVGELGATIAGDEHVRGLYIAMHDAVVVRKLHRLADLHGEAERLFRIELRAGLVDEPIQVGAIDILHDEVEMAFRRLAEVEDRDDALVAEAGEKLGFAMEASDELGAAR